MAPKVLIVESLPSLRSDKFLKNHQELSFSSKQALLALQQPPYVLTTLFFSKREANVVYVTCDMQSKMGSE